MKTVIAALDCGTTTVKAALFSLTGETVGFAALPTPTRRYPDGRITQSPQHVRQAAFSCLARAVQEAGLPASQVAAIGVTNQRASMICVNAAGQPLSDIISWQDLRGQAEIEVLQQHLAPARFAAITGLPCHPVFTIGKILYLKKHEPELFRQTARFVLIQDYLLHAFGAPDFFTDHSNASLTGLLEVKKFRWSKTILDHVGLTAARLPQLVPSGQPVGTLSKEAARLCGLPAGIPLVSGGGDQQCAGIGAGAVVPGICSITLGTAGVIFAHAEKPVLDPLCRITCCAHAVPGRWNLEGLQNTAGESLRWTARNLTGKEQLTKAMIRQMAALPAGAQGALFFPYLAGAGAPLWDPGATGMFLGLKLFHDRAVLLRAVMEGVAMEVRRVLDIFRESGVATHEIRLTGGYTRIPLWNQIQADIYNQPVMILANPQATLLGAAILAANGIGALPSIPAAVQAMVKISGQYTPDSGRVKAYAQVYSRYQAITEVFVRRHLFSTINH